MSRMGIMTKEKYVHLDMTLLQPSLNEIDRGDIRVVISVGGYSLRVDIDNDLLDAGGVDGLLRYLGCSDHHGMQNRIGDEGSAVQPIIYMYFGNKGAQATYITCLENLPSIKKNKRFWVERGKQGVQRGLSLR